MKNIKITITYDGSRYKGWEHQPGMPNTIQGKLEEILEHLEGRPIEILGAGRTDAGVHARAMCANFKTNLDMTPEQIRNYMNRYLPDDICITEAKEVPERFHARYNARGKTYRYSCYVGNDKPVFDRKYVCNVGDIIDWMGKSVDSKKVNNEIMTGVAPSYGEDANRVYSINIDRMRSAASYLMGTHDFASFCGNAKMKKSTVREVDSIDILREGDYIYITYHGTGFLQYMVRIMTGTLLEVGYGSRDPESIPSIIEAKDREAAGFTAPACGLCLMQVDY